MKGRESIEVARAIAVVALPLVLIITWLVQAYAPDDDEARFRRIQLILVRINVVAGFFAWLLAVAGDPEHLARNLGLMAVGLCAMAVIARVRRLRQQRQRRES